MDGKEKETYYRLIKELENICRNNDIKYILLYDDYFENKVTLPKMESFVGVGMTLEDIEKLEYIVNRKNEGNSVETFLNNPNALEFKNRFYDENTTYINFKDYSNHVIHGIYVDLIAIEKNFDSIKSKFFRILQSLWKGSQIKTKNCKRKLILVVILLKALKCLLGEEVLRTQIYNYYKKNIAMKSWKDISNVKSVMIKGVRFSTNEIFAFEKQERTKEKHILLNKEISGIINTQKGYREILTKKLENEIIKIIDERTRYIRIMDKSKKEREIKRNAWKTFMMVYYKNQL